MTTIRRDPKLWSQPEIEGYLLKRGNMRMNWKWRWCKLQDGLLFYFETEEAPVLTSHAKESNTTTTTTPPTLGLTAPTRPIPARPGLGLSDAKRTGRPSCPPPPIPDGRTTSISKSLSSSSPPISFLDRTRNDSQSPPQRPQQRQGLTASQRSVTSGAAPPRPEPLTPKELVTSAVTSQASSPRKPRTRSMSVGKTGLLDLGVIQTHNNENDEEDDGQLFSVIPDLPKSKYKPAEVRDPINLLQKFSDPGIRKTDLLNDIIDWSIQVEEGKEIEETTSESDNSEGKYIRDRSERNTREYNESGDVGYSATNTQPTSQEPTETQAPASNTITPAAAPSSPMSLRKTTFLSKEKQVGQEAVKVVSNHRGYDSAKIQELEKKDKQNQMPKLIEKYISTRDPYTAYNINENHSVGKGSAGEVFLAADVTTGEKVAVKRLQVMRRGQDRLPFILREIEIIATSAHPNIVRYIESFHQGDELWVIMEYMSAGSLYDVVKEYNVGVRFSENHVSFIIHECLLALEYLHSIKRIHRDIKVDNVLMSRDGSVKLADFGTAVQLTFQRLRRTTLTGTPYYMAPELIQRTPYGDKVDIWSVGVSVIEMIEGEPPFYDLDPTEALEAITEATDMEIRLKPGSSAEAIHFVDMCLKHDPQERFSASELLKDPFMAKRCSKDEFKRFLDRFFGDVSEHGHKERHNDCIIS